MYVFVSSFTSLPPLKHRLPLLPKRLQRLRTVLRRNNSIISRILALLAGFPAVHGLQCGSDGYRSAFADIYSSLHRLFEDFAASGTGRLGLFLCDFDQPVAEAHEVGFGTADAAAGEDEVAGSGEADDGGEAVGAASALEELEMSFTDETVLYKVRSYLV